MCETLAPRHPSGVLPGGDHEVMIDGESRQTIAGPLGVGVLDDALLNGQKLFLSYGGLLFLGGGVGGPEQRTDTEPAVTNISRLPLTC